MSSNAEQRLSRHHDGELSKKERKSVAKALGKDDELRAKLDGLAHLSMLISESHREVAADLDSDSLFDAITARIAGDEVDDDPMFPEGAERDGPVEDAPAVSQQRPALRVVEGGKKRAKTPAKPPARVRNKELDRRTAAMMAFGGLAAAAAVALAILSGTPATPHAATEEGAIAQAPPPGSEIEEVDFGSNTGAIFSVEGQEGEQYAVIWISDEKVSQPAEEDI